MRRAPIVVTATVLGTAGVLLFRPLSTTAVDGGGAAVAAGASTGSAASTGTGSTGSGEASAAPTSSVAPSSSASSTSSAASKGVSASVKGPVETDRYGETQVEVTVKNGRITDVAVLAYNDDDPRSAQISQDAIPVLREEVLSKQTAAVDAVSGATYTSNAYEASLQAALDTAGFTAADGSKADTDLATADAGIRGR